MSQLELRIVHEMAAIPPASWDALLRPDDNPFIGWTFLEALESSGCATAARGWWPCHLTAWLGEELVAACPAYVKGDSAGDFSRDWGFAESASRNGLAYYPKLVIGVPFSPVSGHRVLLQPGLDRTEFTGYLVNLALELCRESKLSSLHVLYHREEETEALESAGLHSRLMIQYHWRNRGYENREEWLRRLPSKRRTQIRRESREPKKQGILIRTVRTQELSRDPAHWAQQTHRLYRANTEKHFWGSAYLNLVFFQRLFENLADHVELVIAERDGQLVAGAFNVATQTQLFGRYWGCLEEHRFLHFNVCLYHSIDECIERGRQVFEGGAGGEHKLSRGFDPVFVHTAHLFLHAGFHEAVGNYLDAESAERRAELDAWYQTGA